MKLTDIMNLKFSMVKYGYGQLLQNVEFHKLLGYQDMLLADKKEQLE